MCNLKACPLTQNLNACGTSSSIASGFSGALVVEKGATGCGVSMNALGTRVASDFSANTFLSDAAEDAVLQ